MKVSNWGNFPTTEAEVRSFGTVDEARKQTADWAGFIPRGLGRCYGDSSLAPHILSTLSHNRFLDFDAEAGLLTCQSGCSYAEILPVIVPKGWFMPVTPGTKFVTMGGAIAADVHGKNHHSDGSISQHVLRFSLLTPAGELLECSRTQNADVFEATCGGMGLTGLIIDTTIRLKRIETSYIAEESSKIANLDGLFQTFERALGFTYSVAWVDCLAKGKSLGKSLLLNGEHATAADLVGHKAAAHPLALPSKKKLSVPFMLPSFTLNPLSVKAFNLLLYAKAKGGTHRHITDYETYFYPLDGILHWNRVYGKRGFAQYQFVIPPDKGYEGMVKVLEMISAARMPSFLTVLKYFGPQQGMLSFPMEGYQLALDFPITDRLFPFFDKLDDVVRSYGGRLYLTKDSRMSAEMLAAGYPRLDEFRAIKQRLDPQGRLGSLQSARTGI
jgi:decaprenylphospho-beta-D-ribofuranose 2-oxidase